MLPAAVISCPYTSMYVCGTCIDCYAKNYPYPLPTMLRAFFNTDSLERREFMESSWFVSTNQFLTLHETLKTAHQRHKNAPAQIETAGLDTPNVQQ